MKINERKVKGILEELKDTTLVVATKYADIDDLNKLDNLGVKYFGENRVNALLEKYEKFQGNAKFHMIGTLQVNKVHYIIDKVVMIESVDSYKLIDEIEKEAKKHSLVMDILIQVNIALEESKHGFREDELIDVFNYLKNCHHINVKGLMIMAPNIDPKDTEIYFEKMEMLLERLQNLFPEFSLTELSMGMSNDYNYALKHKTTIVRIGRKLYDE